MVQVSKFQFTVLLAFVNAAIAAPSGQAQLFERDDLPLVNPVPPPTSSAELALCPLIRNCKVVDGAAVYDFPTNTTPTTPAAPAARDIPMSSDAPDGKDGDVYLALFPGNAIQDSGDLNYQDMVRAGIGKVCPSDLGCNGFEVEPVDQLALPNGGRAKVSAHDKGQWTMETCQMSVGGRWQYPAAKSPLVQVLTAGVEAMTNATNLGGVTNVCNRLGACSLLPGGPSVRQTLAPASMKAIYFKNVGEGKNWENHGQLSYSISCQPDQPWDCSGSTQDIGKIIGMLGPPGEAVNQAVDVLCSAVGHL